MQRIIIFGGPDGVGKTTLAKRLSSVLDIPYFKPSKQHEFAKIDPTGNIFKQQTAWGEPKLLDFLKQTGASAVMDRGFPCDWVYSKVLGRETAWETIEQLDAGYARLGALLVVVGSQNYNLLPDDDFKAVADPRVQRELDSMYWEYCKWTEMRRVIIQTEPRLPAILLEGAIQRAVGDIIGKLYKETK